MFSEGILELVILSVHPCVHPCVCVHASICVQNTCNSFCQSAGRGINTHLVTALVFQWLKTHFHFKVKKWFSYFS